MTDAVTNVFKNLVAPISRNSDVAMGFTLDVALETLISWTIRYFISVILAAPLIGVGSIMTVKAEGAIANMEWSTRFLLGLQSCPSIFASQYIVGTFNAGKFYLPQIRIWDALTTIVARTMSRVIILYAAEKEMWGMDKWKKYMTLQQEQLKAGVFAKKVGV
jgi:hypothetical protein